MHEGGPILMRGDSMSAVSWINRCGGSEDPRAGFVERLLDKLELWS